MADFTFDVDDTILVKPEKKGRESTNPPPQPKPVFETAKAISIERLKKSIEEAGARFLGEGEGAYAPEDYESSYAWRLETKKPIQTPKGGAGEDEKVYVYLKAGTSGKLKMFPKYKAVKNERVRVEGEMADELFIYGKDVKATLQAILKQVEVMEKDDGGLGSMFYDRALQMAIANHKKGKKKHNPETDCFE